VPGKTRKRYTVHFDREEGRWVARVPALGDLEATGRTVREARRRLYRKLERAHPGVPLEALREEIHLEAEARNALRSFLAARRRVMKEEERLREAGERVAEELVEDMGLSIRDAAERMGVSAGWVQRLLEG